MAGNLNIDNITAGARQWASDLVNRYQPASEQELTELAKALAVSRDDASGLVGRLRDDDARASRSEMREAQQWLERSRKISSPTAAAFRRYADDAAAARATLRRELASHVGIEPGEAASAYRNLLAFADKNQDVSLRAIADAYITILRALPVDGERDGSVSRSWYNVRDLAGYSHTDTALRGTRSAFEIASTQQQDMPTTARIYASVLAYSTPEIAAKTAERILGDLRRDYPKVPAGQLVDTWLAMQAGQRTLRATDAAFANLTRLVGQEPTPGIIPWMRAYTIVFRAEGSPDDTVAAIEAMATAPAHTRRDPEALAKLYATLLATNHDASADALHALRILLRWAPPGLDVSALAQTYLALRGVVGHREALARTLYLLENAGTPARAQALTRLTQAEVAKARDSATVLSGLDTAVRDLPQRVQGWWERSQNRPDGATPSPTPTPDPAGAKRPEDVYKENVPQDATSPRPVTGNLPAPIAPANTPEGLALYAPGSVYRSGTTECIDLFERAAVLAGVPKSWARSEGLHRLLAAESRNGVVGIPNYTYGKNLSLDDWKRIHGDLKNGVIRAKSSATGLGQLLLRNVDVYYPAGRDGIGVPLQEAAGMLAYIKDSYGNPDNAWKLYGKRHEGY